MRSLDTSDGKTLDIYAAWFREKLTHLPPRIFTLDTGNTVFASVSEAKPHALQKNTADRDFLKIKTMSETPDQLCLKALDELLKAIQDTRYAKTLCKELSELLFPGSAEIAVTDIIEELKSMSKKYAKTK
jgi:hypothetical protein